MAQTTDGPHKPAPTDRPNRFQIFRALSKHRDFRYLQGGQFATHFGSWVQITGKGWLVYELTDSAFQLSLVAFFQGAAMFVMSPIAGTLADRMDRRRALLISQWMLMAIGISLAILITTEAIQVWHLYIGAALSGAFFAINNPNRQSILYGVVGRDDVANAVAMNALSMNSTRIVGPPVAGLLIWSVGVEATFFVQAATYAIAVWALFMMKAGGGTAHVIERTSLRTSLLSGIRYVMRERTIGIVLLGGLIGVMLGWPYVHMMPAYAKEILGTGERGLGILMGSIGAGAVVGGIVIAASTHLRRKGVVLLAALLGNGALLIVLGLTESFPIAMIVLALTGLCTATALAMNQTILQLLVDDQYRGRVMSLFFMGFGLQPLGVLPAGALADRFGVGTSFIMLGALVLGIIGTIGIASKRFRSA